MIRDQLFPHLLTAFCLLLSLCPLWLKPLPPAQSSTASFVDRVFRGVRSTELVEGGSILFRNVKIEPAEKSRSLNSRPTGP